MSTVALEHVHKVYDDGTPGVRDVSLDIADGEFFALLGPSGCGKSTILRMIAGIEPLSRGRIRIDGDQVDDVRPSERDVAMIFQAPVVYPAMSVRQNLAFPLRISKVPHVDIDRRVHEVATLLDIEGLLERSPGQLSGGQQQRVAMGRALIRRPRLLLMDEPMSNLDAALRTDLRVDLVRLQRRLGVTTIYVTHDHVEAMSMADRIAVLSDGSVVQCDSPLALYDSPSDLFVATFVGVPAMGLLRARVLRRGRCLQLGVGRCVVTLDVAAAARYPDLVRRVGHEVLLGVRAEDLRPDPDGDLVGSPVRAELHGGVQVVHVSFGAESVHPTDHGIETAREGDGVPLLIDAHRTVDIFQPMRLRLDTRHLHLFDPHSGDRLGQLPRSMAVSRPVGETT